MPGWGGASVGAALRRMRHNASRSVVLNAAIGAGAGLINASTSLRTLAPLSVSANGADTAIGGVGAAFDEAVLLEPVDEPRDVRRVAAPAAGEGAHRLRALGVEREQRVQRAGLSLKEAAMGKLLLHAVMTVVIRRHASVVGSSPAAVQRLRPPGAPCQFPLSPHEDTSRR